MGRVGGGGWRTEKGRQTLVRASERDVMAAISRGAAWVHELETYRRRRREQGAKPQDEERRFYAQTATSTLRRSMNDGTGSELGAGELWNVGPA